MNEITDLNKANEVPFNELSLHCWRMRDKVPVAELHSEEDGCRHCHLLKGPHIGGKIRLGNWSYFWFLLLVSVLHAKKTLRLDQKVCPRGGHSESCLVWEASLIFQVSEVRGLHSCLNMGGGGTPLTPYRRPVKVTKNQPPQLGNHQGLVVWELCGHQEGTQAQILMWKPLLHSHGCEGCYIGIGQSVWM